MITAIALIIIVNFVVYLFYRVLKRQNEKLEEEDNQKSIGSLYNGKNVRMGEHRMHMYPIAFFLRRGLFIAASVYLFDYPQM